MEFTPRPITLEGSSVRLEPLANDHRERLHEAARQQPDVFEWFLTDSLAKRASFDVWFDEALHAQEAGTEVAWVTIRRGDGAIVGSTRFLDIRRAHRALEIGNT